LRTRWMGFVLALVLAAPALPQHILEHPAPGTHTRRSLWKASLALLVASSAADMQSSLGRRELNPLLANAQGRFGARGIAVKALITGGALGLQWLMMRNNPAADRYAAIANFGMAGLFTSAALHNHTNQHAASAISAAAP
jgi:hypothetical protein